jgi:hypothetical protein
MNPNSIGLECCFALAFVIIVSGSHIIFVREEMLTIQEFLVHKPIGSYSIIIF